MDTLYIPNLRAVQPPAEGGERGSSSTADSGLVSGQPLRHPCAPGAARRSAPIVFGALAAFFGRNMLGRRAGGGTAGRHVKTRRSVDVYTLYASVGPLKGRT